MINSVRAMISEKVMLRLMSHYNRDEPAARLIGDTGYDAPINLIGNLH
jgi:hypothetical protein